MSFWIWFAVQIAVAILWLIERHTLAVEETTRRTIYHVGFIFLLALAGGCKLLRDEIREAK